jgi:hypothetical protein
MLFTPVHFGNKTMTVAFVLPPGATAGVVQPNQTALQQQRSIGSCYTYVDRPPIHQLVKRASAPFFIFFVARSAKLVHLHPLLFVSDQFRCCSPVNSCLRPIPCSFCLQFSAPKALFGVYPVQNFQHIQHGKVTPGSLGTFSSQYLSII